MKKVRKDNIGQYLGAVWRAIPTDNYMTAYNIAEEVGMNPNGVRRLVKQMREDGLPIITDLHRGYKKPANDIEMWVCIRAIEDRISALQDTVATLKRMTKGEEQ